jgi:opacity protein-like surface antigen
MFWRKLAVFVFLFACSATTVFAQSKYEITPFLGARVGGKIDVNTPFVDYIIIRSSINYGGLFDYALWDNFQGEFMWNRQPTTLSDHNIGPPTSVTQLTKSNIDEYQFDAVYSFRPTDVKLKPFVVAGLGWTHFGNTDQFIGFGNKFSYNLGGGVKYYFAEHFGARLDVRWSPSRTTTSQGQVCNPYYGCYLANVSNHAQQGQANLGLIVRF